MRIALVHSYYSSSQPSGENAVVDLQAHALRDAGHEVITIGRYTDELARSRLYPLQAAMRVATGYGADPLRQSDDFGADVIHVHNLSPNFGRRWVQRSPVPVVATMHNFRPLCPAATFFRDGGDCTACPEADSAMPSVVHRCYRDSRVATLPLAIGTKFAHDPVLAGARRIITLSAAMRSRYAAFGVPPERLVTVPNFVSAPPVRGLHEDGYWLYVGRLTPEKGILKVAEEWPANHVLKVVGSGPLKDDLARLARPNVEVLGQLPPTEVRSMLGNAFGLVFPSRWLEGLPTVYLEALASGLPVLAWPESVVGDLVAEEGTGLIATGDMASDLDRGRELFPYMRQNCLDAYAANYTRHAWLQRVHDLYAAALV